MEFCCFWDISSPLFAIWTRIRMMLLRYFHLHLGSLCLSMLTRATDLAGFQGKSFSSNYLSCFLSFREKHPQSHLYKTRQCHTEGTEA